MKKKIITFLLCIIALTACPKKIYKINTSNLDKNINITIDTMSQYNNIKEITDKQSKKVIYDILKDKQTTKESVNDIPTNPNKLYKIILKDINDHETIIYIYKKNNKYYIEQPYNGIYESNMKEFQLIENLAK